ncbi:hypothetical protein SFC07_01250 [Corynebacterium callunae]|uniref:hypothetical protein n=1 Tax=Corynebacterium callunae TaxID=1721 RepID=UPI003981D924
MATPTSSPQGTEHGVSAAAGDSAVAGAGAGAAGAPGAAAEKSSQLTAIELLNPEPVSKWNLYVLIGCCVLVVVLVFLGPWIYPHVAELTATLWNAS